MSLLEKSIKIAQNLNYYGKFKVAAFIYSGKRLLSIGQNNMESTNAKAHYFGKRYNVDKFVKYSYIHAEIDAIGRLWGKYHISGKETLIVVRLNSRNEAVLAKPCKDCQVVLDALGFKKVEWTE